MYKIGICGHFGKGKNLLNGQTVKTKTLTDELKKQLGYEQVYIVDSHNWKQRIPSLIFSCIWMVRSSENIIILPAYRGLKVFLPLFLGVNKIFNRKLHYVVIGGWLPSMLQKNPKMKKQLAKFAGIYVETHAMVSALKELGLKNIHYLPNFKQIQVIKSINFVIPKKYPYKLCTFSRVMKEKGIEEAIEAVKAINTEMSEVVYTLDIYGQIESRYVEHFQRIVKYFPDYINYKGIVAYSESTEVLKHYFALLFPTSYEGEGLPGTVIDAFSSGVPVVASNWKYNKEVISHKQSGYIYSNGLAGLTNELRKILNNPEEVIAMKKNCIIEAEKYNSKRVIKNLIKKMGIF